MVEEALSSRRLPGDLAQHFGPPALLSIAGPFRKAHTRKKLGEEKRCGLRGETWRLTDGVTGQPRFSWGLEPCCEVLTH